MKYPKVLLASLSLLILNGCLKVEDNNNDNKDLVNAINAQTEVIKDQDESENTVSFQGLVINAIDNSPATSALITVNLASKTLVDGMVATDGKFEVPNLPANSDIEVIVSSSDNKFLRRAFFLNTGTSSSSNTVKDFGMFTVSEPQEVQITVLNNEDNSPVSTLEFVAFSHSGNSSSQLKYKHASVYDSANSVYKITIPKQIHTVVRASLDLNKDGKIDFKPESANHLRGTDLYINSANTIETITVYVSKDIETELQDVEYRVSIIDDSATSLSDAELSISDENNTLKKSSYDETTEQHVISAKFLNHMTLRMPAFNSDNVTYQSASISISKEDDNHLSVRISGGSNVNCCFTVPNTDVIEIALQTNVISNHSSLEVITKSKKVDPADSAFTVFYSQGVSIPTGSVSLKRARGFTVVKGNESNDDFILAGTTLLTGGVNVATTTSMSLNNTKLEVKPEAPLLSVGGYLYDVAGVEVIATKEIVDISGDSLSFEVTNTNQVFDINDVKLDNENYTTNGVRITNVNTANEASTAADFNRSVYFYLPTSIQSLQNFTMRQLRVTNDNSERVDVENYNFVRNGSIHVNMVGVLKLADNEVIVRENLSTSVITASAQEDTQVVYRTHNREYMSDNTTSSANNIAFEYSYETKSGEVFTGTITIPVQ